MIAHNRIDWKVYEAWTGSDADFARSIGMYPNNFAQYKRRHLRTTPTSHGHLPAIRATLQTAPDRTSAPDRTDTALAQLDIRLQVVEAFIMAQQQASALPPHPKAPALPSAPQRTDPPVWVSRGTDIAQDMRDAIDAYATRHRLEKREVLDVALRAFFAGQEVDADA